MSWPRGAAVVVSIAVAVPLFRWANRMFKGLALERGDLLAGKEASALGEGDQGDRRTVGAKHR